MTALRALWRLRAGIFPRLLIALLLVALLPLTAFWQLERQRMIDNGEAEAQQRLELFADSAVQHVDDWMRLNLSVLELAAGQEAMRTMSGPAQQQAIAGLAPQLPWAYLIHTVNLKGWNVARSDGRPANWYGDREYFKELVAGRPYGIDVQIGRTSHLPALIVAVPIMSRDGRLAGMLVEATTLDHVTQAVTSARLGRTGHVYIMTNSGRLIADRGVSMLHGLRDFRSRPVYAAARRGDGFYHYRYRGAAKVAEIRHTDFGWIVVAQQQQTESMAAVSQASRYAWLLLALTTLAVTLISALVARGFAGRIARNTRALEAARAEAEKANRSKTSFVAAAVHDLMQPLNAARMFVDAARARLTSAADREVLSGIDSALEAEDEILSTLLDISRLESGTFEVHERDFAPGALFETLGREFGILARARGIELRVARCSAVIHSDEALLRRILQNYLSNAVRYSRRRRVLMGCRRIGGLLRIEVWDSGPGIPPEHHKRIFLEFQRLDTGAQSNERGAGLGLAIVERIAKRLGHRIGLRSWLGRGSVFFVDVPLVRDVTRGQESAAMVPAAATLPARMPAASMPAPSATGASVVGASASGAPLPGAAGPGASVNPPSSRSEPAGGHRGGSLLEGSRVWSVEDDPQVRQSVAALLTGWGCEVVLAATAAEALSLAEQNPSAPDLLLLDYRLPDGNGPALVPDLFRRWGAEVPVMIVSAERNAAVREQAQEKGWGFLAKPVNPSKLRAAVTHLLLKNAASV
ncbi:MAG TPA: ATP-binding protein [Steroidobacteraceae bacterium]|nr:ATP-binding protein [Steroidobacteraceae bacterium]